MAPFPTIPVMTIALGQLSQYYFWTSPFAYAGFMVEHLDVVDDKDKVGYYAGMLASSFAFGRISSAFLWGIVGDRYGYLLVTYISMFAIAISSIAFGFSMTFVMAFTSRFIAGVCTGQTVAGKSLVSDVCGEEHELVGMGLIATSWSLGLSIGPGVGGFLAEPATFFPETFSRTGLFGRFPYLLPNLVGAGLAVITVPMTHFSLGRHEAVVRRSYRHELLKGDTDMESSRRDASKSDMSLQTPHRTPSRSRNQFFTPGRIFYPSPSMVRKGFDTPTKTPGGSVDFAAAGLNIPSPVPQSPSEDGTNQPRERAPSTEDDGRSVDYRCCAIRNVEMFSSESLLSKANVRTVVGAYALYSVVFAGFGEVFPLWALSSVERGGLDWSTKDLGEWSKSGPGMAARTFNAYRAETPTNTCWIWVASRVLKQCPNEEVFLPCGVSILIFEAIVIPFLTKRIGITTSQRLASLCSALSCLAIPFLSRLSSAGSLLYWATFVVLFSNNACLNAIFLNISVAINNCTDESRRGEVNGLATTSGALSEAIAPVLFAALFAASINHDNPVPFDFHLVFLLMGIIMVLVLAVGWSSIKTVYGEELVVEVHDGSHTDQAEPAAGTQSKNSPENSGDFPISTADSAVCV